MRRALRATLIAVLCWLGLAQAALAREQIDDFISQVTVNPDASLSVTESIVVLAEGDQIKRGIFRDFPTTYTDRDGLRYRVGFEVIAVRRNGNPTDYTLESISNGVRIRIGRADTLISSGYHRYVIEYRTTRQIGYFDGYDELYWNVTGNGWAFPIVHAAVTITLPPGAAVGQHAVYTGPSGGNTSQAKVTAASGAVFAAETTAELAPNEGFTVAVAFPKGVVAQPSAADQRLSQLRDNLGIGALLATLAAVAAYFGFAWNRVGRDPPKGVIVPLFRPPQGIGPSALRYIWKQSYDNKAFAAAILDMAVKGHLVIEDSDDGYALVPRKSDAKGAFATRAAGVQPLTAAEARLYAAMPNSRLDLGQSEAILVQSLKSQLGAWLKGEFEGAMFLRNYGWFALGALVSLAGLVATVVLSPGGAGIPAFFVVGWSAIWWGVVLVFSWNLLKGLIQGRGIMGRVSSIFGLMFMLPFFIAGAAVPGMMLFGGDLGRDAWIILVGAVALAVLNLVFYFLLRAPTVAGRKMLDQIEGFRLYLTTAEEERLKALNPPDKTPELFERYLPHAMALDCETEWTDKFAAVLAAAAVAGASAPIWYHGSNWDWHNPGSIGDVTHGLDRGIAASVPAASSAPGGFSGSGGGGSSGGGGGGGGGGGW